MGSTLSYNPDMKLKRNVVLPIAISQINENTMLLENGDIYRFHPSIKGECFRLLTNFLKNPADTRKMVVYHDAKIIYTIVRVPPTGRWIEEYHSTITTWSLFDTGYFLKEKEI